jgi:Tfp pilus assembly protein PilZ
MVNLEKRRFLRHSSSIPVRIHSSNEAQRLQSLLNIGEGGLAFESETAWPLGVKLRILWPIPLDFSLDIQELQGKVVWCRPHRETQEGTLYEVGVEFIRPDSEAVDMTALIEELYQQLAEVQFEIFTTSSDD